MVWVLLLTVSPRGVFSKGTRLYLCNPPALSNRPRHTPRRRPRGVRKGQTHPMGLGLGQHHNLCGVESKIFQ